MRILSIGQFNCYGISNTCLHRTWALKKLAEVDTIDFAPILNTLLYAIINRLYVRYHLPIHLPVFRLNKMIKETVHKKNYDIVWIDKGTVVSAKTLIYIKAKCSNTKIVGYSPDNMVERHNQSQHFIESLPYYDYYITTKSYTIDQLKDLGVKNVIFVNNAYEKTFHHPYDITTEEKERLGGKIGFIGAWEKERCESILFLAKHGLPIRVWGGGEWTKYKGLYPNLTIEDKGLFSDNYNKALSAFDISLCFLRKMNKDLQTTRTMEIPACGSLLMAERTVEHERLFKEDEEAVFFSNNEELLEKCTYYLSHPDDLKRVSNAGYQRCQSSGYSNDKTIKRILDEISK